MSARRYLCSELVALRVNSTDSIVNLEEIWREGALLEAEDPVENGVRVEIRCGQAFFAATVTEVEHHEFGWRVTVEFSPLTPWSPDNFQPRHMLDVSESGAE